MGIKVDSKAESFLQETFKRSLEDYRSSHSRMNSLMITVDGAGIYLVLELMKYLKDGKLLIDYELKLIGLGFVISLLTNFLSQFCMFNVGHNILKMEQKFVINQTDNIENEETKMRVYQVCANAMMWISILMMFAAIIGIATFMFNNF